MSRFPHQKKGPRWVARSKISFSIEIFNLDRNLEFFWSLCPLGTPSFEEPPEPKTGTARTVPSPNRNRTEPNRGHPAKSPSVSSLKQNTKQGNARGTMNTIWTTPPPILAKNMLPSGPKKPWQPQTWQDLTWFSLLDFSLLSPDFKGLVLLNCTYMLEKKQKIQWRVSSGDGAPKLQISVPCRGRTCPDPKICHQICLCLCVFLSLNNRRRGGETWQNGSLLNVACLLGLMSPSQFDRLAV